MPHSEQGRALCVLERALPTEAAQLAGLIASATEQGGALCVLERALPTEAAQLAGLNHSYRARQSTLCSREGSTNRGSSAGWAESLIQSKAEHSVF